MALKGVLCVSLLSLWVLQTSAQLSISLARIEGQVGENVTFNCTSVDPGVGENIFLEVQNAQGGFDVFDGAGRLDQSSMGSVAFFSFGPLMSSDNGLVFRCRFAGSLSSNAVISVIFAVMITDVTPDDRTITLVENRGEVFNLTLTVEGNPFPTYTWTQNDVAVSNGSNLTLTPNSIFANVVRENMGFYKVVYDNTIGMARYNFTLDIQYQSEFPENAVVDSPETRCENRNGVFVCGARTGSSVTLVCNAMGNPTPTVTVSPSTAPTTDNNIVFQAVTVNNTGNYSCTASSPGFNDVVRRFELTVAGPPGSVSDLTTTIDVAAGTITFTWIYPDSLDVPITGFVISITRNTGEADSITVEVPPNQLSLTLPLSRFLNQIPYTASVTVENLQGSSEPIFDPFTIPDPSSASNIGASRILSLLMIAVILLLLF